MWNLAIDFGTSNTTGATWADGAVRAIDVGKSPRVPSVVLLSESGEWVVGREADNQSVVVPERVERAPKRRLGKGQSLLLGGQAVPITDAVAALLGPHAAAARQIHGGDPEHVVLTHPARWGPERIDVLRGAAATAGFRRVEFCPEPVAAAHYVDDPIEVGQHVAVYDLGGGTFDTAVMRRTETSFKVVGLPGGNERIGGEDFDHRMYLHLGAAVEREDPEAWEAMSTSDDRRWRRAAADLLTQARDAKEQLSRSPRASIYLGALERDITVTREEFDALIADDVDRTVEEMARTIAGAGLGDDDIVKVYLVGGSSRLTLVQEKMGARFGDRISTWDDPKGVVVLGAAKFSATLAGSPVIRPRAGAGPGQTDDAPAAPVTPVVSAPPPRTGRSSTVTAAGASPAAASPPRPATPAPAAPPASSPPPGAVPPPPLGGPAPAATPAPRPAPAPGPHPAPPPAVAPAPHPAPHPHPYSAGPAPVPGPGAPAPTWAAPAAAGGAPGSDKMTIAWIGAALGLVCCAPAPAVGLWAANEAKNAGHPQAQAALIVNLVSLGLSVLGFMIVFLGSLGSGS